MNEAIAALDRRIFHAKKMKKKFSHLVKEREYLRRTQLLSEAHEQGFAGKINITPPKRVHPVHAQLKAEVKAAKRHKPVRHLQDESDSSWLIAIVLMAILGTVCIGTYLLWSYYNP